MLTEQQIEDRRKGIGGSDMAAILGVSPYKQAIDVFFDKRPDLAQEAGYVPDPVEGLNVELGNLDEWPIAELYAKRHGVKVHKSYQHHQHKKLPYLRANIDAKIVGVKRGLEVKRVNWRLAHLWGESGTDLIAEYYLPQVHFYLSVLDYPEWDVAALLGGDDLRDYRVTRDPEWDDIIEDASRDFWVNHVEAGIPPAVVLDHKGAQKLLKKLHHQVDGEEITLEENALHWHQVMEEAKQKIRTYEAIRDGANVHLMELIGDAAKARIPGVQGAYIRERKSRKGFTVEPTEYIQMRYSARIK